MSEEQKQLKSWTRGSWTLRHREEAGRESLESAGHMFPLTVAGFTW